jgi:NADH dehydrogenase [ubiquinone] 1 alpha subcomplex assembly factor 7
MSERVRERIRAAIRERGPMTFDRFMTEALYGPGGFYEGTPVGASGHYVTSPHVHPVFSRLVGAALEELWAATGRPVPLRLVEVGAGDGTMGRELVAGFARAGIELEYEAVEASAGARAGLASIARRVVRDLAALEPLHPGLVVANELLDNLPFRRVRRRGDAVVEVRVDVRGERFVEVEAPDAALAPATGILEDGQETTVPVGAFAFVEELAVTLRTGYALLIDYGSEGGPAGEVHAYRDHRVVGDVLEDPGSADITAGVDLAAVAEHARACGLSPLGSVPQSSALRALGHREWVLEERTRQGELLNADRGVEALRARDARTRAGLLVDPAALGRLRWLLLATPGLPSPAWLERAADGYPRARPE